MRSQDNDSACNIPHFTILYHATHSLPAFDDYVTTVRDVDYIAEVILYMWEEGMWGFGDMNANCPHPQRNWCDKAYVQYAAARLGAYHNVWFSLANEWPLFGDAGEK